ncbi:hypothetical protein Q9Q99_05140 [Curtobacterium flaccumfaciens]|nr:hypothetical protein Q9Q99_05140 [Curtobacterium flaccumfaciens]
MASPWTLGPLHLPNRVVMGSMHTGLEVQDDGGAGMAAFYRERAAGGTACIITGGIAVNDEARGGPDFAVFGVGGADERFRVAVQAVHDEGGTILAQLFHAGRYALASGMVDRHGDPQRVVAPSALPWAAARGVVPTALTAAEVERTIEDFAVAARTARAIGFDGVEIMASEGYLINQFQSPLTNLRDDEWGGDAARRRRFAIEVVRAVRTAVPDLAVTIRLSGADLMPGSSTDDEVDALVHDLLPLGLDGISVGIGWHESRTPTVQAAVPHGAWLAYASRIAGVVRASPHPHVRVIASNRMTDLRDGEAVLADGLLDAVALARPFLADPALVDRSLAGRFALVNTCIGCNQACLDRSIIGAPVSCLVNPAPAARSRSPHARRPTRSASTSSAAVRPGSPRRWTPPAAATTSPSGRRPTVSAASSASPHSSRGRRTTPPRCAPPARSSRSGARPSTSDARPRLGTSSTATPSSSRPGWSRGASTSPAATCRTCCPTSGRCGTASPRAPSRSSAAAASGVDTAAFLTESPDEAVRAAGFAARWDLDVSEELVGDVPQRLPAAPRATRPGPDVTVLRRSGQVRPRDRHHLAVGRDQSAARRRRADGRRRAGVPAHRTRGALDARRARGRGRRAGGHRRGLRRAGAGERRRG